MGRLLMVLWPLEVARIILGLPLGLELVAAALFFAFLSLAVADASRATRLLSLALVGAIALITWADAAWEHVARGLQEAMVFAAFVPAVFLLRNAFAPDPRLEGYRRTLAAVDPRRQARMLLVSSHLLGSALAVGAFAVVAPVLPNDADRERRRSVARAAILGISLSVLWSPAFVAMAVVSDFLPQVPLWQFVLTGLVLALVGLSVGLILLGSRNLPDDLAAGVGSVRSLIAWTAATAIAVITLRAATTLTTLEAAALALLLLSGLLILRQGPPERTHTISRTRRNLDLLGPEISVVALAFMLGSVMRASDWGAAAITETLGGLAPGVLLVAVVGAMLVAVVLGVHAIVAASVLLALHAGMETGLADLVVGAAVLLGWACSAMVAPVGLILIVATGLFRVPRASVILSHNAAVALVFAGAGVICLLGLNSLVTP